MKVNELLDIKSENATVSDWQNKTRKSLTRLMNYRETLCDDFGEDTVADFEKAASSTVAYEIEGTSFELDSEMDGEWFEMVEITRVFSKALDSIGESENGAFGRTVMNKKAGYSKKLYDLLYRSNKLYAALEARDLL